MSDNANPYAEARRAGNRVIPPFPPAAVIRAGLAGEEIDLRPHRDELWQYSNDLALWCFRKEGFGPSHPKVQEAVELLFSPYREWEQKQVPA